MFAAGSLKQMDSLLELFVVFDSEDVHVYTVYFTNARVYKGSTALNGHVSKSITNLLVTNQDIIQTSTWTHPTQHLLLLLSRCDWPLIY